MNFKSLLISALLSMKANKLRVFLTMTGIIIGITSVVIVNALGAGLERKIMDSIEKSNESKISVVFVPNKNNTFLKSPFDNNDLINISKIDGVKNVSFENENTLYSAEKSAYVNTICNGEEYAISILAYDFVTQNILEKLNNNIDINSYKEKIIKGRFFEKSDFRNNYIVLTKSMANKFYKNYKDAVGKTIKIGDLQFKIIGIIKSSSDYNGNINLVQETAFDRFQENIKIKNPELKNYKSSILVNVKAGYDTDTVLDNIKSKLESTHKTINGSYEAIDPSLTIKEFKDTLSYVTTFALIVTAISLVVGGIGIMNVMYITISERRQEIGLRKIAGATPRDILYQFCTEATITTFLAGLGGIFLGYVICHIMGLFIFFQPILTINSIIISSGISIITGIIFGVAPAMKAAKLNPIDAINKI